MPGKITELLQKYKTWLDGIDAVFNDVQRVYPDAIPCHGGCSHCCYSLFAIPAIDGYLLWEGLKFEGQASAQQGLKQSEHLFTEFKNSVCSSATIPFRVEHFGWKEFDVMVDTFQRPCPLLTENGWCGVYGWRPRICRLAGTVFKDLRSGVVLHDFCPLAIEAREEVGFEWAPFDISGMDGYLMEFRQEFQELLLTEHGIVVPSGVTFPAAGVLEAAAVLGRER